MKRLSLRWRLILVSGSLALATALVIGALLHADAQRQLLGQLEKTLETKCDEVITVLENTGRYAELEDFLVIETTYRFTPYTYFYQIRDARGRTIVRSKNLGRLELPMPTAWGEADQTRAVHTETARVRSLHGDESLRIRTERLEIVLPGQNAAIHTIQTAVSLGALTAAVRAKLASDTFIAGGVLVAVFLLLWFVTTGSLRPMVVMTRKASQIGATNLRARLPVAGHGDELDALAIVVNSMLDRLASSMQQMEQFSSDAAHQLRTPLTRIRGELDLILRGDVESPLRQDLQRIEVELDRLSRLCGRLLLLGRLDLQRGELRNVGERVDLTSVAEEIVEQMIPLAREHGVELRLSDPSAATWVRGNRMLIVEAVLNLIDNAIRWTPRGGGIVVSVQADNYDARLCIADTGPGIPREEREKIFQPFYRIPHNRDGVTDEGSGLGLAIVRAIARAHGGSAEVCDAAREGSVFQMSFPAHPPG